MIAVQPSIFIRCAEVVKQNIENMQVCVYQGLGLKSSDVFIFQCVSFSLTVCVCAYKRRCCSSQLSAAGGAGRRSERWWRRYGELGPC